MKSSICTIGATLGMLALVTESAVRAAAPSISGIAMVPSLTIQSDVNVTNQIQYTDSLSQTHWITLTNLVVTQSPYVFVDLSATSGQERFYQVVEISGSGGPGVTNLAGMSIITNGSFTMGDSLDGRADAPVHQVTVSAFAIDQTDVTYDRWSKIYQYAVTKGYTFDHAGMGKGTNHPAQSMNWYDAVKWCNARSEYEGLRPCYYTNGLTGLYSNGRVNLATGNVDWSANGYRLPTEAEWERAARGGAERHRFPWTDTDNVSRAKANYMGENTTFRPSWDLGPVGYNPAYAVDPHPYTSPVGSFALNDYGLADMAGNVFNWCWDWYGAQYYTSTSGATDPRGPTSGSSRVQRGGSWASGPEDLRCMMRNDRVPITYGDGIGLRCVRNVNGTP